MDPLEQQPNNETKAEALTALRKLFDEGKMQHFVKDPFHDFYYLFKLKNYQVVGLDEEIIADLDIHEIQETINELELEFKQKEVFKQEFEKIFNDNNKDKIIQRYLKLFLDTDYDDNNNPLNNFSHIENYKYYLSDKDFSFFEKMYSQQAESIVEELKALIKEIDIKKIEEAEEKIKKEQNKEKHKRDKSEKKYKINSLARIFTSYDTNLLKVIIDLLDIDMNGIEKRFSQYEQKKLENKLQNLQLEDLEKISKKYNEIFQKAKELGGDLDDEEDLGLVLEELE